MQDTPINHVTDTALWVATFRANESKRADALFQDPLAEKLVGARGPEIAQGMRTSKYVEWSVVLRTVMIDDFILTAIAEGVDTVLNLGAGLDTRPYRMSLPPELRWIEVDYPYIIEHKNKLLKEDVPKCKLERIILDLSQTDARLKLFREINAQAKKVLVITEGVVPYLSVKATASLAEDLRAQDHFKLWIVDYFSSRMMKFLRKGIRRQMQNAPFQFFPDDWEDFFKLHHWQVKDLKYMGNEAERHHRPPPMPKWMNFLQNFMTTRRKRIMHQMSGYALLE
jgi:methyltransferase (TIGR00027 family)